MDYILTAHLPEGRLSWVVAPGETLIGRTVDNGVVLPDASVSRAHARLVRDGDRIEIEDLKSRNGTAVNQERIAARSRVGPGDVISIGTVDLKLDLASESIRETTGPWTTPVVHYDWGDVRSLPATSRDEGTLGTLLDLGGFLVRRHTREEIYETVLARVEDLVGYQLACLFLLGESGLAEVHRRSVGAPDREPAFSHTVLDKAVEDRSPLLVTDRLDFSASMLRQQIRSAIAVPLFENTKVIGVLYLDTRRKGKIYTEEDLRRVELLATTLALKLTNSEMMEELERAALVQRSILPIAMPVPAGYAVYARLEPCASVAGDLYDFLPLPAGRHAVVLGDVSGHGVGAALLMATVLTTIRALVHVVDTPLALVSRLGDQICDALGERGYVTLFVGMLDSERHLLTYVNAGHPGAALLLPDGTVRDLGTTGPAVGMRIGIPFEAATVEVSPGALLCTWSDGLHEAQRPDARGNAEFGRDQLLELYGSLRHEPLEDIARGVFERVDEFMRGHSAQDDQTLLLLRREG